MTEVKRHLKLDDIPDDSTEDILILGLITAGREYCENYTGKVFVGLEDVPQSVKQAILLLVGYWHRNREATLDISNKSVYSVQIPFSVKALLDQHRIRWWD